MGRMKEQSPTMEMPLHQQDSEQMKIMEEQMTVSNIHQRLASAMQKVTYIQKEKKQGMRYSIVSHDSVTSKVRPALLEAGVIYYPVSVTYAQQANRTECKMRVRFVNIDDQSDFIEVESFGYGLDDQDKGPGKAMSYAVKYALLKTLGLETGDDPDLDQSVEFKTGDEKPKSSYALKKENPNRWSEIESMIRNAKGRKEMLEMKSNLREEAKTWPQAWKDAFNDMWAKEWDEMND